MGVDIVPPPPQDPLWVCFLIPEHEYAFLRDRKEREYMFDLKVFWKSLQIIQLGQLVHFNKLKCRLLLQSCPLVGHSKNISALKSHFNDLM